MNVFFTASYQGKATYQSSYNLVRVAIERQGVALISPEIGNYKKVLDPKIMTKLASERLIHYEAIKKGILLADAVVIEISQEDFQLGHEATLAMQAKKPVLCLSLHEDFSQKINHRYFFGAKYNEYTVDEIVEEFIRKVKKNVLSERFNLFLSPTQLNYLEKTAQKRDMNRSEYLRDLIEKDKKSS